MSIEMKCPTCGNAKTRKAKSGDYADWNPFKMPGVAIRKCEDCGQVWEPAAPTWALIGGIVAGTIFLGLSLLYMPTELGWSRSHFMFLIVAGMGVTAIVNSILRLRKRGVRLIGTKKGDVK